MRVLLTAVLMMAFIPAAFAQEGERSLLCNAKVAHTLYTPSRQQTAVTLLQKLGARLAVENVQQALAYPVDFDPFIWY